MMPDIRLYNTLTRAKEPLRTSRPGSVIMYVCGPADGRDEAVASLIQRPPQPTSTSEPIAMKPSC